jgi:hypothetical protein
MRHNTITHPQGTVGTAIASAIQAVPVLAAGGHIDGANTTERFEGGLGSFGTTSSFLTPSPVFDPSSVVHCRSPS